MNDFTTLCASNPDRDREKKRKLREENCAWQRVAACLAALNIAVCASLCGVIARKNADIAERDSRIEQWKTRYNAAAAIERDVVQAYGDLVMQVEAEQAARDAQAGAYAELDGYRYIGECTITAYCPCEECCGHWADGMTAAGIEAVPGIVAVDPDVIPLGSTVLVDGLRYLAADTGVTGSCIDICMTDHRSAEAFGVQTAVVWIKTEDRS